ncbi:two-component sensor histidine kinase [Bacillus sp. UMB0899]|uniref:cache domain-containing sensor histidine kinase n=1 Tax=Metabacillus schmidteae TaxID=2730405 RepID=UPI000C80000C|nr:sensor histidine kinase [Metabacillus schmidteae]PMC38070.1 two-component sensor histidine kinase [Bacillus sp. UMB0899]
MKNLKQCIGKRYNNLKIKYKLIIIISTIMVVCLSFIILGFQYAFNSYDEQIYRKSSQVLIMSSNRIEDELKNIEEVSYRVLADNKIQKALIEAKKELTSYDQYQIEKEIRDTLTSYIGSEEYIQSIHLFDTNGKEYQAGKITASILYENADYLEQKAKEGDGRNIWVSLKESQNTIFSARQLRSYQNLSLDNLGTLIIEVSLNDIVKELPREWGGQEGRIAISDGDDIFFAEETSIQLNKLNLSVTDGQGYQIQKLNGRNYFVTYSNSTYANWTYWNVLPFETMFAKVTTIKFMVIFLFFIILLSSIYFFIRFSKRITDPIENLVSAMKVVQTGDFKAVDTLKPSEEKNEIGILHRNFIVMIKRINDLINENYEKQLLIKDTEFKALQSQINPHFLYNTLESINWLAKINKQNQISKMVESLGFLLRNAISLKNDVITVQEEIEMVQHYITIQKFRFEERLDFSLDIHEDVKGCLIPKLIIQPLVENAINYALEMMMEPCKIKVSAYKEGENLYLSVEDNGLGMDKAKLEQVRKGEFKTSGNGIGLSNIDSRIKFVFGSKYGLQIDSELNMGTKVFIVIPYQTRWSYV